MIETNDGHDLVRRIKRLADANQAINAAQIQFIALEEIATAYGDRWRAERGRIMPAAAAFISKRTKHDDVLIPCDNGFIIVFADPDPANAAVAAHAIGRSLRSVFFGADATFQQERETTFHPTPSADPVDTNDLDAKGHSQTVCRESPPDLAADAAGLSFRFQPVWDVKRQAVTTYYIEPVNLLTGQRVGGYQFEKPGGVTPRFLEIDDRLLRISETVMRSLFQTGRKAIVGVSIHISSLTKQAHRQRILETISQFDAQLLQYRAIKVSAVEPGFPRRYLRDTVSFLSAQIPHIVVGMSAAEENFSTALDCGAWGLGYTIPPDSALAHEAGFFSKLTRDAAAARASGKRFFVEGHLTPTQALQCAECGVDFLASPIVWPPLQSIRGVLRWNSSRLGVRRIGADPSPSLRPTSDETPAA
ncbi:MAG: hypothetical protein Q8R02_19015 [Hyphomonadaceae bacterium]|nr:hypothetical protein [Hyphomonadaceae bacterium]